jgi:hypothetical protein
MYITLRATLIQAYKALASTFPDHAIPEESETRLFVRAAIDHCYKSGETMDCADAQTLDPYDFCKDGEYDEDAFDAAYAAREEDRISRLPPTYLTDEMARYIPDREDLPPRCLTVVNLDAVYGDEDVPDEDVATVYEWYDYRGQRCPEPPPELLEVYDRVER